MWDIVLLAEDHDLPGLTGGLKQIEPAVTVTGVADLAALEAATEAAADPAARLRLVSVCSGVIVPAEVLHRLPGPSYNFHPGPPEYRGIFPAVFALYDGAPRFGATAHEMTEAVDAGTIVGTEMADVPPGIDRLNLEALSRQLIARLFVRLAPQLINRDEPLAPIGVEWSGPPRTRKDFEALCVLPDDVTAEEFERRHRAVGEGPEHALKFQRFGRTFSLDPQPGDGTVYKGGQAVGKIGEEE